MPDWEAIEQGMWTALAALDVAPAQAESGRAFRLALIGAPSSGKSALACALAARSLQQGIPAESQASIREYRLPLSADDIASLEAATALILLLDATKGNYVQEVAAADYLAYLGRPMRVPSAVKPDGGECRFYLST
jgi:GTPase SAR1 family protein